MSQLTRQTILEKVLEITDRIGASEGIEIVDVELMGSGNNRVLRIFIDKPAGVTHADCENVSEQMSTILDSEDVIPGGKYTLEVSSPGVERKLKKLQDFIRFSGQKARVSLKEPIDDRRNWEGVLSGVQGDVILLEASPGKTIQFPIEQVERANLKFDW